MTGWRKWSLAALVIVLAYVLAQQGLLTGDFVLVAGGAFGAFCTANTLGDHRPGSGSDPGASPQSLGRAVADELRRHVRLGERA